MQKLIGALVCCLFISLSACGVFENMPIKATQSSELQQRGKHLRAEMDHVYERISHGRVQGPGEYIDTLVAKYIPPGTSFEDAEAILLGAGFKCSIANNPVDRSKGTWVLTPTLVGTFPFASPWYVGSAAEVNVFPTVPANFHSPVAKIFAVIRYATL